jgi:hypothetical protein
VDGLTADALRECWLRRLPFVEGDDGGLFSVFDSEAALKVVLGCFPITLGGVDLAPEPVAARDVFAVGLGLGI